MIEVYGSSREIDILAIGVHPDDIELSCAGTILKHIDLGYRIGLADLTQGELGSRGSATIRLNESRDAAEILGVDFRVNLGMRDGFFTLDERHKLRIVELIRRCRPKIILANALDDRHPDHGRAATLVRDAFFYSGLRRITTGGLSHYRADALYHYIQDEHLVPDFCVDVTGYTDKKFKAIEAYATQFNVAKNESIQTPISSKSFTQFLDAKMRVYGRSLGVSHAEGFNAHRTVGVNDLVSLT